MHAMGIPFFAGVDFRVCQLHGAMLVEQLKRMDGILRRLKTRRAAMAEILAKSTRFKLSPHHDPENALSARAAP